MTRKLIIESGLAETRAALMEDDVVLGFWISGGPAAGPIHAGRVRSVDAALEAAFVDVGLGEDGFLPLADVKPPNEGEIIAVQIKKPAMAGKGPLLTRDIVLETPLLQWRPLAGKRQLVLAREITAQEERKRLQTAMEGKGFKGELTLRPFAGGIAAEALVKAFVHLRQSYDTLLEKAEEITSPGPLANPRHPAVAALLHFANQLPQEVVVAGVKAQQALKSSTEVHLAHRHIKIISTQTVCLFEEQGVEEVLEGALQRVVTLPCGGRLVFDEAEALTAIDVDVAAAPGQSKRGAIIRVCSDAVPVIVRQLLLRSIGGQVVIDFPALAVKGGGQLASALKEEVRKLPGGRFGKIDQNGLAVLILPRKGRSLLEQMTETYGVGPVLGRRLSGATLAATALRQAAHAMADAPSANVTLTVAPAIEAIIKARHDWLAALDEQFSARLNVLSNAEQEREQIDVKTTTA